MSGYENDMSEVQAKALSTLKGMLAPMLEGAVAIKFIEQFGGIDRCLLRFLRFYAFDPVVAAEKWNATLKWRTEANVDKIAEGGPIVEKISRHWPGYYNGYSKDFAPLQFFNVGAANPGLIMKSFTEDELREFYIYWMERSQTLQLQGIKKARELNPDAIVKGSIEIYDLSGLSWGQLHMSGLAMLGRIIGSIGTVHYPSNLYKGFMANSGYIFAGGWKIISPVLHEQTRERIKVSSGDCKEEMLVLIEEPLITALFAWKPAVLSEKDAKSEETAATEAAK